MTLVVNINDPSQKQKEINDILGMLKKICGAAKLTAGADGLITPANPNFCTPENPSGLSHGCRCLCEIIAHKKVTTIAIGFDLKVVGGMTVPDDVKAGSDGTGTDVTVTVENKNRFYLRK